MKINGRPATPAQARRLGTVFVVVGLVLAVVMSGGAAVAHLLGPDRSGWVTTNGTVTGNEQGVRVDVDRGGRRSEYQRLVTWTVDGQEHSAALGATSSKPFRVGEQVTVSYDPARPDRAELQGGASTITLVVGGAGLAFGALFAGIGLAIRRRAG
ncbi:DUF3592 domain-containing protein [Auraticoccus monumenti]|uniref:DUF3592 domain-containing protein n=1 Tax=Auraticoccus monumenti TaxID=675864 RepID=A0A1G6T625_9ACTN|nr:DUF3592 domain-containing protein [Auraticoccus monumenti]SDD24580.1 Protein of unknown function [Auraticoccus monumenti]